MAIQYGWFGNASVPTSTDIGNMDGTAITHYMPYGLREITTFSSYETAADAVLAKVSGTNIKVLLEIPSAAVGDSTFVSAIDNEYSGNGAVAGYYLEEPEPAGHDYDEEDVEALYNALSKDLVIDLRTDSSQEEYDTWSAYCDVLIAPDYVLATTGSAWEGIQNLSALGKLKSAKESNFWHVIQAGAFDSRREPKEPEISSVYKYYEMWWLAHRSLIEKAKGIMFFSWPHGSSTMHDKVTTMCTRLDYESINRAFDNHADDHTDSNYVLNLGDSDLLYRYQYYSSDWWLLVMDKNPDTASAEDYPKQVRFKCNLDTRFDDFIVLNNRIADYYTETYTDTGRSIYVTRDDPWMEFNEEGNNYGIERGEVRVYRFACGG